MNALLKFGASSGLFLMNVKCSPKMNFCGSSWTFGMIFAPRYGKADMFTDYVI